MAGHVAALDQGTTSTRCIVFDASGREIGRDQREHRQIYPRPGWVEHDPIEIRDRALEVLSGALEAAELDAGDLAGLGITNQRETCLAWNRETGRPYANAIVWQDTRTDRLCRELAGDAGPDRFRARTGLPLATYFSGPKLRWLLDENPELRQDAERGRALFGTIDSWLIWNLTGGPEGGAHVTDVTNASRTLLMNLRTLDWDEEILEALRIPRRMLPEIRPSSEAGGWGEGPGGVAICGNLGDQQAALVGQACFSPGEAKNTYGTGCFLLANTGHEPVESEHGLITTLAYQLGEAKPVYALEGSIAIAGALVQWLRDNLGLIETAAESETLAAEVEDAGGMVIVPAFSGLFAPHWRSDARGVMVGLTRYIDKRHICRAALEAVAWQVREVLDAMRADAGIDPPELGVDGGMVANALLMQIQADALDLPVARSEVSETTSLGAAYAAGLASGLWSDVEELRAHKRVDRRWQPAVDRDEREARYADWHKAVERSLNWVS